MAEESVVYVPGTWDLFHIGHLNLIKRAKELGTQLIVGVSSDTLVQKQKGHLPVFSCEDRCRIVRELRCVDQVVVQRELLSLRQLVVLNVDVLVLGDDWEDSSEPGILWMKENKRFVALPRTPGISSTFIRTNLKNDV